MTHRDQVGFTGGVLLLEEGDRVRPVIGGRPSRVICGVTRSRAALPRARALLDGWMLDGFHCDLPGMAGVDARLL